MAGSCIVNSLLLRDFCVGSSNDKVRSNIVIISNHVLKYVVDMKSYIFKALLNYQMCWP